MQVGITLSIAALRLSLTAHTEPPATPTTPHHRTPPPICACCNSNDKLLDGDQRSRGGGRCPTCDAWIRPNGRVVNHGTKCTCL